MLQIILSMYYYIQSNTLLFRRTRFCWIARHARASWTKRFCRASRRKGWSRFTRHRRSSRTRGAPRNLWQGRISRKYRTKGRTRKASSAWSTRWKGKPGLHRFVIIFWYNSYYEMNSHFTVSESFAGERIRLLLLYSLAWAPQSFGWFFTFQTSLFQMLTQVYVTSEGELNLNYKYEQGPIHSIVTG